MILHYTLLVYILITGIIIGNFEKNRAKKLNIFLLLFVFFFLSALRSSQVGNDTKNYLMGFTFISNAKNIETMFSVFEPGYTILNKFTSYITSNPQVILIVTSAIMFIFIGLFLFKTSQNIWFSVYLLFTMNHIFNSMNTIRTSIAMVILLLAFKYFFEKKKLKFLLTVFLASLFHITAISFLSIIIVDKIKYSKKNFSVIILLSSVLSYFLPRVAPVILSQLNMYEGYVGSTYMDGEIRLGSLLILLVNVVILLLYSWIQDRVKNNNIVEKNEVLESELRSMPNIISNILLLGVAFSILALNFSLLNRISVYFMIFSVVAIPNSLKLINNNRERLLILLLIVILFFLYSITIFTFRPEWNRIYPYTFYWNIH